MTKTTTCSKPVVGACVYIPEAKAASFRLDLDELQVRDHFRDIEFSLADYARPGYIGVPRSFGCGLLAGHDYETEVPDKQSRPDLFKHKIVARDPAQKLFMESLADTCKRNGPVDLVANAATGSGKSVTALWLIAALGYPALVCVPTNKLATQWHRTIQAFFSAEWHERYVGHVQQDRVDYADKLIVVSMTPSLVSRDYGDAFVRHFGTVIVDEVHRVSAPVMSRVLSLFPAKVRVGMTATNKRGALKKVCDMHLGRPMVVSTQEVMRPKVLDVQLRYKATLNTYNEYTMLSSLAELDARNDFLCDLIVKRGIERDRNVIVLSDRVKHLEALYTKLSARGYGGLCGVHAASRYTGLYRVYAVTGGRSRLLGRAETRAAARALYAAHIRELEVGPERTLNIEEDKETVSTTELDRISKSCKVILATYGTFSTGVDEPRLDMGIEATPKVDVRQAIGRILRLRQGKPTPEWYSITDQILTSGGNVAYPVFVNKGAQRQSSFAHHSADVKQVRVAL